MRVAVVKTTDASPDGILVRTYEAGQTYEMPADLASVFLREGWGRAAGGTVGPDEHQALEGPTETKPAKRKTK